MQARPNLLLGCFCVMLRIMMTGQRDDDTWSAGIYFRYLPRRKMSSVETCADSLPRQARPPPSLESIDLRLGEAVKRLYRGRAEDGGRLGRVSSGDQCPARNSCGGLTTDYSEQCGVWGEGCCSVWSVRSSSAVNDPSVSEVVFTITERALTRVFSWLKVPTRLALLYLRHYLDTKS